MKRSLLIITDGNTDKASSRIRAYEYVDIFKEDAGFAVKLIPRIPNKKNKALHKYLIFPITKRFLKLYRSLTLFFKTYDVVYIQRAFLSKNEIKMIKSKKSLMVYDIDDAIYTDTGDKWNSSTKADRMGANSDRIIVASPVLKEYFLKLNSNVTIIHTPIDVSRFNNLKKQKNIPLKIGWIGSHHTRHYLKEVLPALKLLSLTSKFELVLVGAGKDFKTDSSYKTSIIEWNYSDECKMVNDFDIGIMPLSDEAFAYGKGGYKLLLYKAAGIPAVASPIGINTELIQDNFNGFLAGSTQEWVERLELLLKSDELRRRLGDNAKQEALSKYDRSISYKKLKTIINSNTGKNDN